MRSVVVLLTVLALSQAELHGFSKLQNLGKYMGKNGRVLEEPMRNFAYCVRDHLAVGLPEFGVPSFNPLAIENSTSEIGELGLCSGYISVSNLLLELFTTFDVTYVSGTVGIIPPRFEVRMDLTWANLRCNTEYDFRCQTAEDELFGTGTLVGESSRVVAAGDVVLNILPPSISSAWLRLSTDGLNSFQITGLRDDEAYSAEVSQYILENAPAILDELYPLITDLFLAVIGIILGGTGGTEEDGLIAFLVDDCFVE